MQLIHECAHSGLEHAREYIQEERDSLIMIQMFAMIFVMFQQPSDGSDPDVLMDRLQRNGPSITEGRCLFFNDAKGFGFITCSDGSGDVFVHFSEIKAPAQGSKTLQKGESLEFGVVEGRNGKRKAVNVTYELFRFIQQIYKNTKYLYKGGPAEYS